MGIKQNRTNPDKMSLAGKLRWTGIAAIMVTFFAAICHAIARVVFALEISLSDFSINTSGFVDRAVEYDATLANILVSHAAGVIVTVIIFGFALHIWARWMERIWQGSPKDRKE